MKVDANFIAWLFVVGAVLFGFWRLHRQSLERPSFDVFKQDQQESKTPDVATSAGADSEDREQEMEAAATVDELPEEPTPYVLEHMITRELNWNKGEQTLIMRERRRQNCYTGHLIIWSGRKKRAKFKDCYFDLGVISLDDGNSVGEVVAAFIDTAKEVLRNLPETRTRRKSVKTDQEAKAASELSPKAHQEPAAVAAQPVAPEAAHGTVKLKPFPAIFRGVIEEMGHRLKGDASVYGVLLTTDEGKQDELFGSALEEALRCANAGLGDHVEIIKTGRKFIEKGKAPMNLFTVSKFEPDQSHAH